MDCLEADCGGGCLVGVRHIHTCVTHPLSDHDSDRPPCCLQFDYVVDVTSFKTKAAWGEDPMKEVPTKVKSAFTRQVCLGGGG